MRGDAGRTQARCDCRVLFAAKLGACRQWCVVVDRTRVGGVGSRCVTDDGSRGCRQADRVGVLVKDSSASHSSGDGAWRVGSVPSWFRSEEHTSELQSLMRISYAVFCLKKKKKQHKKY